MAQRLGHRAPQGRRAGFTLIELLVVVIIIGILAGIGVKQYGNAQDRARNTGMISLVRGVQLGVEGWKSDHRGVPDDLLGPGAPEVAAAKYLSAADETQGAGWPVKYTPGGYLPKTPWSDHYQQRLDSNYNCEAVSTIVGEWGKVLAGTETLEAAQMPGQAGVWEDGVTDDEPGRLPQPGIGPALRAEFGYIAYGADTGSGRYIVLGVGKLHGKAWIVAAKSNN